MATKRNALAWMKFDPLIVAGEVDGMTVAQQGAYFILIRHLWPKGPMPEADIRRYLHEHTAAIMPTLAQYGEGWSMPWLEEAREEASAMSNSQRDRAVRGWEKRSPGNAPAMPRQAPASPGNAEEKEKRGEREEKEKRAEEVASLPFASTAFVSAWEAWEASRRERRKPITPTARRLQCQKLATLGEARAIAALLHSAESGYQGIFEPRTDNANGSALRPTATPPSTTFTERM